MRHAIDDADRQLAVTRDVFAGYRGWIGADARTRLAGAARLRRCVDGVDTDRMEPRASTHSEAHVDAEPDRRGTRTADLVATIIGLLLLVPWVLWLAWQGAWIGALTGLCQSSACRNDAIETGMAFAVYGPVAVWVLALVASIVRLALRRTAWWIPLVGFLLAIVVQRFGGWIAAGG
ncbi:MAG TPA: hypothetical protein VM430_12115 [Microbacterium sp.]|nr:hypothetical protein [Microbacterium sp.]